MKLTQRIFLLVLVTVLLSTLANLLLSQYQEKALHSNSEKILAQTIIQSLRDTLVQDIIDGNKLRITNLLISLKEHDNPIEFIFVTKGSQHTIFAHSFKRGFPRYLAANKNLRLHQTGIHLTAKYSTQQGLIYEYSEPLIAGLDTTLYIGINQSEIAETLAKNKQNTLIMSLFITLLALVIAYFWSKQITMPLAKLAEQIRHFGAGKDVNFSGVNKNLPEFHLLATAFQTATKERQQALADLQEREQDLEITLNSIGDAVIATDANGNITRMNPVAEQLTGWSLEEARGQSVKSVFPIVDATTRKPIENPVEKVIATGETVYLSNHTTLISRDSTEYQIADSAAPIRNRDDDILGMVLVFNDVTEQYKLRQSIIKSEKRYQTLTKIAPVGIYYTDKQGSCLYVNKKWSEITGIPPEGATGDGWKKGLHPDDRALFFAKWNESVQQNIPFKLEYRFQQADGVRWVLGQALAEEDMSGEIIGYVGTITDITDRKEAEEENTHLQHQLHHSQKMDALGKLTGGIAHDYNNMLGIILGYAELLGNMVNDHPRLARYVHEIRHAGERGAGLTAKLLRFSRQKASNAEMLNINTLLLDEQHMLEKTLTARIKLVFDLADDLWPVCLNSSDLEDAVINLSINALHAIEGNGKLTIQTSNVHLNKTDARLIQLDAGDYIILSFTDTGCGMNEATKEKIFEPFFSTKGDQGTGLGLSQLYGFVESSNGAIKVYSELGYGSRFMLYFPRYQATRSDDKLVEQTAIETKGDETILVVDDEPALLDLTCEILSQQGYTPFRAENAKQALEILEKEAIDLLLTDVIMPEMNGYELAAIVRKKYPGVKIQMASGFNDERHINMVDESLNRNLLYKPYNSQTLLERIRVLLDRESWV